MILPSYGQFLSVFSSISDKTYSLPNNAELKVSNRYRSEVVWFYHNQGQTYFNCNLGFQDNFCQKANPKVTVQTANYRYINCQPPLGSHSTNKECFAIITKGDFVKENGEIIHYQASNSFVDSAINYQNRWNAAVLLIFFINLLIASFMLLWLKTSTDKVINDNV